MARRSSSQAAAGGAASAVTSGSCPGISAARKPSASTIGFSAPCGTHNCPACLKANRLKLCSCGLVQFSRTLFCKQCGASLRDTASHGSATPEVPVIISRRSYNNWRKKLIERVTQIGAELDSMRDCMAGEPVLSVQIHMPSYRDAGAVPEPESESQDEPRSTRDTRTQVFLFGGGHANLLAPHHFHRDDGLVCIAGHHDATEAMHPVHRAQLQAQGTSPRDTDSKLQLAFENFIYQFENDIGRFTNVRRTQRSKKHFQRKTYRDRNGAARTHNAQPPTRTTTNSALSLLSRPGSATGSRPGSATGFRPGSSLQTFSSSQAPTQSSRPESAISQRPVGLATFTNALRPAAGNKHAASLNRFDPTAAEALTRSTSLPAWPTHNTLVSDPPPPLDIAQPAVLRSNAAGSLHHQNTAVNAPQPAHGPANPPPLEEHLEPDSLDPPVAPPSVSLISPSFQGSFFAYQRSSGNVALVDPKTAGLSAASSTNHDTSPPAALPLSSTQPHDETQAQPKRAKRTPLQARNANVPDQPANVFAASCPTTGHLDHGQDPNQGLIAHAHNEDMDVVLSHSLGPVTGTADSAMYDLETAQLGAAWAPASLQKALLKADEFALITPARFRQLQQQAGAASYDNPSTWSPLILATPAVLAYRRTLQVHADDDEAEPLNDIRTRLDLDEEPTPTSTSTQITPSFHA
ncbi:uncharacterized protein MONBRDRAFT_28561 [Monosiga brevicollis MX1]|uniref:Uncharacterized protein n=1 Tax=Monosiga brevicollis TaxID=81824 RepID=A9V8J2_MONBE|nr:uncharacterized protein MONBRDRAFT_28561 [Monosiga brevicollis MX1]EDQ86154.1 predicted protein [Monosiga brevicollis MX1]|eukprot:XP_001749079.1 hypothetical protein [Monosiga brevicollis MX1]